MKSLNHYIFEQYSNSANANKLQEQNGGFMPKDYTLKFLKFSDLSPEDWDEAFEDENGNYVPFKNLIKQVNADKCKMQVHFDINPMDDDRKVDFYLNDKLWCSGFIGCWNWDKNQPAQC